MNIKKFTLVFDLSKNNEQKKLEIKDQLYKAETKSVTPISPSNDLYKIETTRSEIEHIFESLKPFIKASERMICNLTDGSSLIYFGPQKKLSSI